MRGRDSVGAVAAIGQRGRISISSGGKSPHESTLRWSLIALTLLLLNACASHAPVDPLKLAKIHIISLTGFSDPEYKALYGPALRIDSDFNAAMAKQNLHLGAELKSAVTSVLENAGYEIAQTKTERTDAFLDVNVRVAAYIGDPPILGGKFKPGTLIEARLTDSLSGETLFRRTYSYSTSNDTGLTGWVPLVADSKYVFDDQEALLNNPKLAADGIRAAAPLLAQSVAVQLSK